MRRSQGRIVGDRVGSVDYALDVLREFELTVLDCPPAPARAGAGAPPYALGSALLAGVGGFPGADPEAGRVARRLPRGRVAYSGTADRDVRYLTFASPSDVRTIAPTGPAHAFLIVYAGGFPTGTMTITTTFRDGRARTDSFPAMGD